MTTRMLCAVLPLLFLAASATAQDCHVPLLLRGEGGFEIRFEVVPNGESRVLVHGSTNRVVTPIVPVSEGVSGDVVRGDEDGVLMLRCDGEQVRVLVGPPGGGPAEEVMSGPRDAHDRWQVRVNAIAEDGEEAAFWIRGGEAGPADGPVIDMFRGAVPLRSGDVIVSTETRSSEDPGEAGLTGSVPVGAQGPYATVPVRLPGGATANFILDLAASRSVVHRELVPPGTDVQRLVAVEHSSAGTRESEARAQAAGGAATDIGSVADLPWIELGGVRVDGFQPLVLDGSYLVDGEPISGIIGLDVLGRAQRVRGNFGRPSSGEFLELGSDPLVDALELPLREVRGVLFAEGRFGGVPILLLLDSGARLSVLPESLASAEGWPMSAAVVDSLRGADGRALRVRSVSPPPLKIGDWAAPPTGYHAGSIPVLDALGLRGASAILGQPFWRAIGVVEIDFERGLLRIPRA